MSEEADLQADLELHRVLRGRLAITWNAFFARFPRLRPVQLGAIGPILEGHDVLVTAPTAGGKTEAVVAPLCERFLRKPSPGLGLLIVTPTRALVNDIYLRLETPMQQLRLTIGRKTADYAAAKVPEQVVVTTPESLESMMTFRKERLATLRAIVLDEIHLLDGGPRGDQLRQILRRLRRFLAGSQRHVGHEGLQVVAMSATVPDPQRLAQAYLASTARVVAVPGQRTIEHRIVEGDETDAAQVALAVQTLGELSDVQKVLVFVNSRKAVDTRCSMFRQGQFANTPVFGHHGSLSKAKREETEARFRDERRAICVATMTLEVGIDIGDIDVVVCMDPPASLAGFLQRIGRGCRRLAGRTRVVCVARDRAGRLIFEGLIRQAGLGLPVVPRPPFRRSVLVQQVLGYLRQVPGNARTREQLVGTFAASEAPAVSSEMVLSVCSDMVRQGMLVDERGAVRPAADGWEFIESVQIYSNIDASDATTDVVDADTGLSIAKVASAAGRVNIAGRGYEILPGSTFKRTLVRGGEGPAESPSYDRKRVTRGADVGHAVAGYLGLRPSGLTLLEILGRVYAFTWLGAVPNRAIVKMIARPSITAKAGDFAIFVEGLGAPAVAAEILSCTRQALATNCLGSERVEGMAQLGPHLRYLSDQQIERAREDWLDVEYLTRWIDRLGEPTVVDSASAMGADLLALAGSR